MESTHKKLFMLLTLLCLNKQVYSCKNNWQPCGDTICCCSRDTAECMGRRLTYIPKFPRNVTTLRLNFNDFQNVTQKTFENTTTLAIKRLDLGSNGILRISHDAFHELRHLFEIDLSNNNLINARQLSMSLFNNSWKLKVLRLNNCGLRNISNNFFEGLENTNLEMLALQHNGMTVVNEMSIHPLRNLKCLDYSNNWIEKIVNRIGHMTINSIFLANNEFNRGPPLFCDDNGTSLYPNLEILDLSWNNMVYPNRKAWWCLTNLKELNLSGNVLYTIHNDTFSDLVSLDKLDVSSMTKPIQKIQPKAFNNMNLKTLNIENNKLLFMDRSSIPFRKFLKYSPNLIRLYLGYNLFVGLNDVEIVEMVSPLSKLKVLNLNQAHLTHIPHNLLQKFNLTTLHLKYNEIHRINGSVFMNIKTLRYLGLGFNKISIIDTDTLPDNLQNSLQKLDLSNNPISCVPCKNIWFREWIDRNHGKIKFIHWPKFYQCDQPPEKQGTLFIDYKATYEDCEPVNPTKIILASTCTFLLLVIVLGILAYKGRWYIRYWLIKYRRKFRCTTKDDPQKQTLLNVVYDAYIIYHDKDRQFATRALCQFMEREHNYKLFIWDRQFEAGAAKVDVMVDNIYNSNHVIAVISKHFLKDPWCDFQLNVTIDRQIELKRKFLTLITLEDVDKQLLSKSWCVIFTKTPTAEWCDRKNDIKRRVFEHQILAHVPCITSQSPPNRLNPTVNSEYESL